MRVGVRAGRWSGSGVMCARTLTYVLQLAEHKCTLTSMLQIGANICISVRVAGGVGGAAGAGWSEGSSGSTGLGPGGGSRGTVVVVSSGGNGAAAAVVVAGAGYIHTSVRDFGDGQPS
ncbi:hypothetical protein BJV74DRAFT_864830 [Russula compacta]|nr:hypothetical protein BJV74DRAFT_864830 [Russula compacta]